MSTKILLNNCVFRKNGHSKSLALLRDTNNFLYVLPTFAVAFLKNFGKRNRYTVLLGVCKFSKNRRKVFPFLVCK